MNSELNIVGELKVTKEHAHLGISTGHIEVEDGGHLNVFGTCAKGLTVRRGGRAVIYGVVVGDAVNLGGELLVFGVVTGEVKEVAGKTTIDPEAQVAHGWAL